MTDRHTVDSINSDQLDQLYDDLARTRQELADRDEGESADAAAGSYAGRAEAVEAQLTRVIDLYGQWVKAGPPPLGTSMSRWWDRRLVELRGVIHGAAEQSTETTANNPPGSREHIYLSTGCWHGDHNYCKSMTGLAGAKRPGECKFCQAQCQCLCHIDPPKEQQP